LDLFSGTGNISYEFASRGVQNITSVDSHSGCTSFIHKTARELDLPIQVVKLDVLTFLDRNQIPFDVIFCDPPYNFTELQLSHLVHQCLSPKHLKATGLLVLEHIKHVNLENLSGFTEARRYGQSVFSFFRLAP
jgi:16S rRNA G966 N2-methylase RsmD